MGHSKNRGRRRLTLPLQLRAKMIGCAMFIGGFMGLITSAQLDPISAHVERVIDGDTIQVRVEGSATPSGSLAWTPRRRSTPLNPFSISDGRQAPSPRRRRSLDLSVRFFPFRELTPTSRDKSFKS